MKTKEEIFNDVCWMSIDEETELVQTHWSTIEKAMEKYASQFQQLSVMMWMEKYKALQDKHIKLQQEYLEALNQHKKLK